MAAPLGYLMHMNTTDRLRLLAKHRGHIIWEPRFPYGELKQDMITMKDADGKDLVVNDGKGGLWSPVMPLDDLNDLLHSSYIREDIAASTEQKHIFRLTSDGLAAGLAP